MGFTQQVLKILSMYEGESPGVKQNIARILMNGTLGGTGKILILAVDQGFEHGPRTFLNNPSAFDPHYHFQFAIDGGLSAYAAPLGWLEAGSDSYLGRIPTILKINSGNSLYNKENAPDQAITASIDDALRLGCVAIGFTIYPGSDASLEMMEELRDLSAQAKACGLAVVVWSYARGNVSKPGETATDVIAYGAHMACLLGANIIKVKLSQDYLEIPEAKNLYQKHVNIATQAARVEHIVQACFNGRRIVIFSGGDVKDEQDVVQDARDIKQGNGFGSIIGRNFFQRSKSESFTMLSKIFEIYNSDIV